MIDELDKVIHFLCSTREITFSHIFGRGIFHTQKRTVFFLQLPEPVQEIFCYTQNTHPDPWDNGGPSRCTF